MFTQQNFIQPHIRTKTFRRIYSRLVICITVAFLVLCCFLSFSVNATTLTGKVIKVSDGDTISILDRAKNTHKIRLAGIDAPEKSQPFGQKSKDQLAKTVFGKQVKAQCGKSDRYGRAVCKILLADSDVNLEQIRAGFAWHYTAYASAQTPEDRNLYSMAEERAHAHRMGLWRDKQQTPPWEWRHNNRKEHNVVSNTSSCPCSGELQCTGQKGGHYCTMLSGKKRYLSQ